MPSSPRLLPEQFLESWNENCGSLPRATKLSSERKSKISQRIKAGLTLEQFADAVHIAAATPFLRGESPGRWRCDFDFLVSSEKNLLKVLEGSYGQPDAPRMEFAEVSAEQWLGEGGCLV